MGMKYRAAKDSVTGQVALFASEKQGLPFHGAPEFPVAIFTPAVTDFPLPVQQLAENMADLLNHKVPQHRLSCTNEAVFYSRTDNGIALRTKAGEGVSTPAVCMVVSSKSSVADLGHAVLARMDQDFMKRVCDTIVPDAAPDVQHKGPGGSTGGPTVQP